MCLSGGNRWLMRWFRKCARSRFKLALRSRNSRDLTCAPTRSIASRLGASHHRGALVAYVARRVGKPVRYFLNGAAETSPTRSDG